MNERERIESEILWFESLLDSIDEGDIESARRAIEAAILLKRKERSRVDTGNLTP